MKKEWEIPLTVQTVSSHQSGQDVTQLDCSDSDSSPEEVDFKDVILANEENEIADQTPPFIQPLSFTETNETGVYNNYI